MPDFDAIDEEMPEFDELEVDGFEVDEFEEDAVLIEPDFSYTMIKHGMDGRTGQDST